MSAMMMNVTVSDTLNVGLRKLSQEVCVKTINALAEHYGFSATEAEELLGEVTLTKKTSKAKKMPSIKKDSLYWLAPAKNYAVRFLYLRLNSQLSKTSAFHYKAASISFLSYAQKKN